jgi:predicted alpha-1,2-mannosidase
MIHSRRSFIGSIAATSAVTMLPGVSEAAAVPVEDLTKYVQVFIGTGGAGHTFPAATVPFGAVQMGPDTGDHGWKHCSGYHYDDKEILGFSHTHLSGTGVGDMLDFRVSPGYSKDVGVPVSPADFTARFEHADEHAEPGYYAVTFADSKILAEFTATERVGLHRYTFPESNASFLLNLQPVWRVQQEKPDESNLIYWSSLKIGEDTIEAGRSTKAWADGREIYCSMKFSKPFVRVDVYQNGKLLEPSHSDVMGDQLMCVVHFASMPNEVIQLKTGISGVDVSGAANNLKAEAPAWNFNDVRLAARAKWQQHLSCAIVTTDNMRSKQIFYTGLYHAMLAPTLFDDIDGRCKGMDGKVHMLQHGQHNYSTYSLWDTYRALHPMFTLIQSDRVSDLVSCIVRQSTESPHGVTVWPLQGMETGCMVGYHSAPVVAEALVKGFRGIDAKAAYTAFCKRAEVDDYRDLGAYRKFGYVPCDLAPESASKTCDYSYDDWAVAAIAEAAGERAEASKLRLRSMSYKNLYDAGSGFIRPRYADGHWATPFNPKSVTVTKWRDYTEANGWETTFLAQHDGPGLAELLGGNMALERKLDELFAQSPDLPPDVPPDMTGMVGQYCQGNEPCHHIVYFYNVAGAPHKTQKRIHQLVTEMYGTNPDDGMSGNDDCGQMSAWYCMNAIGFYPVDPVSGKYDIGTPLFDRVVLSVGSGRTLSVEARRESAQSIYVKSVTLNGRPQADWKMSHQDLSRGGRLVFELVDDVPALE